MTFIWNPSSVQRITKKQKLTIQPAFSVISIFSEKSYLIKQDRSLLKLILEVYPPTHTTSYTREESLGSLRPFLSKQNKIKVSVQCLKRHYLVKDKWGKG